MSAFLAKWIGVALIIIVGLIHLITTPHHFEAATYLGWLFLANFAGSLLAAVGIYRGASWGWLLGVLIAAVSFVAYLISRIGGLPGTDGEFVGHWNAWGIISLIVEALFVVLYLVATTVRR